MRTASIVVVMLIASVLGVLALAAKASAQPYPTGVQPPPNRVPTGNPVVQPHADQPARITPPVIGGQGPAEDPAATFASPRSEMAPNPPTVQQPTQRPGRIIRASLMIGQPIWNTQDQLIGTISDVVIDYQAASPTVLFAISSGLAAVPLGWVVVPANVMQVRHQGEGNDRLVLNIAVNQFRNAPHIDPNHWDRMSDPQFLADTEQFYRAAQRTAAKPLTVGNDTNGPPRPLTAPGYSPGGYGAAGPGTGADVGSRSNDAGMPGAGRGHDTPRIGETTREATGGNGVGVGASHQGTGAGH